MRVLFPFHRKRKTRTEQTHLPFTAQIDMHASDVVKENLMEIHVNYHYRMIKLKNQKLETIFLMIYDDDFYTRLIGKIVT